MNIDIDKYLREHVPYSIEIMLSHEVYKEKYHEQKIDDNQILRGVFVGSIAKGRMLLEVIGINLESKSGQIIDNPNLKEDKLDHDADHTPVYSKNLRGKMADIVELKSKIPEDMEKIRQYLVAANKYELHLTKQRYDRDLKLYDQAIPLILKLIDENIYLAHEDNIKIKQELMSANRTFADALNRLKSLSI